MSSQKSESVKEDLKERKTHKKKTHIYKHIYQKYQSMRITF